MGYYQKGQYTIVPNITEALKLTGNELKIYVALCSRADQDGGCYPAQSTIGADTGLSVETCKRALNSLKEQGFIFVENRVRPNGSKTSNYYRLLVKGGVTSDLSGGVTGDLSITKPNITKNPTLSSGGQKSAPHGALLTKLIEIVNPKEKPTADRQRVLNGRLKDYSEDEIITAARAFAKSEWHRENKQMSIDNLLAPSKFGRWYADSLKAGKTDAEKEAEYLAKYAKINEKNKKFKDSQSANNK